MAKSTNFIKSISPHFMRAETVLGWTGGEDEEIQTRDSVESRSRTQRGGWGRMSTLTKSTKPNKYPWTWAEIERRWRAEKEEGQIVRVSYLCSDLVWPWAT